MKCFGAEVVVVTASHRSVNVSARAVLEALVVEYGLEEERRVLWSGILGVLAPGMLLVLSEHLLPRCWITIIDLHFRDLVDVF